MRLPFRPSIGVATALFVFVVARAQTPQPPASTSPGTPAASAGSSTGEFAPRTVEDEDNARFDERDVNKDGWLSGSEAVGLRHYDSSGEGEISREEFLAGRAAERLMLRDGSVLPEDIDLFSEFDSTGSGYISGLDIDRGGVADFDTDHNNRVTREEFYAGKARQRREMEERAAAAREDEKRRRLAAGEPEPPPPLSEVLQPRKGMMRGRVLTPDGKPVSEFTMEIVAYNIDQKNPRIDGRRLDEPNLIGRFSGREGYYEIRLPDGSFGFAATITIKAKDGSSKRYALRPAGDRQTIDYIEIQRSGEGVVKNLIWDPSSSEIKARASGS